MDIIGLVDPALLISLDIPRFWWCFLPGQRLVCVRIWGNMSVGQYTSTSVKISITSRCLAVEIAISEGMSHMISYHPGVSE